MNHYLENYCYSLFIFFSLAFSVMLFFRSESSVAKVILSLNFLVMAIILMLSKIISSEDYINYPHLSRILSPLVYLVPPLIYLFHYYLLRPEKKFNYYFLLLGLPFLFQIAEFSNYYFSPVEDKIQELNIINFKKDFLYYSPKYIWINPIYHLRLKIVQYVVYWIFIGKDFIQYLNGVFQRKPQKGAVITYWLLGLFVFRLLSICYFINSYFFHYEPRRYFDGMQFILIADSIYLTMFLLFNPKFFDNLVLSRSAINNSESLSNNKKISLPETNDMRVESIAESSQLEVFNELKEYLKATKYYLDKDCTAENISIKLRIPQRTLSSSVRAITGLSLKDFINKHRIEFIVNEYLKDPLIRAQSMTLIAEMAGFGTRQSLYIACSKLFGDQPKVLFEKAFLDSISVK